MAKGAEHYRKLDEFLSKQNEEFRELQRLLDARYQKRSNTLRPNATPIAESEEKKKKFQAQKSHTVV